TNILLSECSENWQFVNHIRIVKFRITCCKMPLTDEERIEIVLIVGDGYKTIREACEIFAERHPGRTVHYSTVSRLVQRFKDTGSIKDSKRSGRPKSATGEDNQINTLAVFRRSPIKSQRKAA